MKDPDRSPCKVGKMEEEEEGMLMQPLPPLPYAAKPDIESIKISDFCLFKLNRSNVNYHLWIFQYYGYQVGDLDASPSVMNLLRPK